MPVKVERFREYKMFQAERLCECLSLPVLNLGIEVVLHCKKLSLNFLTQNASIFSESSQYQNEFSQNPGIAVKGGKGLTECECESPTECGENQGCPPCKN